MSMVALVFMTSFIRLLVLPGMVWIVVVSLSRLLLSLVTTEMGNIVVTTRKGKCIVTKLPQFQFGVTTLLALTFLLLHLRDIATQTFIQLLDSIRGQRWDNRTLGHSKFLYRHEKRCEPANLVL